MNRDMELVKRILQVIKETDHLKGVHIEFDDYTDDEVKYHNILLYEAGLIDGFEASTLASGPSIVPIRLTWEGHEFIDNASNSQTWEKAKHAAGSVSFSVLSELLKEIAKTSVGLS